MKTLLCQLAEKYACDKTPSIRHSYTPFYHQLFCTRSLLHCPPIHRVLEIGVAGGASMRMWRDYFPEAQIFGVDNDPANIFQADRIHTVLCDSSDSERLGVLAKLAHGEFDLIIDDGSHYPDHQISAFKTLLPFLSPKGMYVIEDVLHFETVSKQISLPHVIYRFNGCTDPADDTLIVYSNGDHQ